MRWRGARGLEKVMDDPKKGLTSYERIDLATIAGAPELSPKPHWSA